MTAVSQAMQKLLQTGSVLRKMFEEGKKLSKEYGAENVYDFSLGNPSTPAPESFNEALKQVIDENDSFSLHSYMSNAGYEETRAAIAADLNERFNSSYTWENITMTVGAANAIVAAFKTLIDPGDEVVVFAPFFLEYANYIANFGGIARVVPPNPPTFIPDFAAFGNTITEKTKAVILNNPNNPTGIVYDAETIKKLAAVMEDKQKEYGHAIYLITDEPYRELVYDGVEVPFVGAYYKNTMMAYSFSKSMSIPGERIGYLAVSPCADEAELLSRAMGIAVRVIGCVNAPSLQQKAIAKVLGYKTDVSVYDENRKLLMEALDKAGFEYVKPQGAFYLWVKAPIEDDTEFSEYCKNNYRVLVAAGEAFYGPGWVRIAYCVPKERIVKAAPYFIQIGKDYGLN